MEEKLFPPVTMRESDFGVWRRELAHKRSMLIVL
jgi:hypothetical protein